MYCIVWIVCIVIFVGFGFGIIQSWCGFSSFRTQGSQSPRGSTLVIGLAVSAMTTSTSSTFSSGFRIQILDVFLRYRCSLLCNKIMKKLQELFSWKNSCKIFHEKFKKKFVKLCLHLWKSFISTNFLLMKKKKKNCEKIIFFFHEFLFVIRETLVWVILIIIMQFPSQCESIIYFRTLTTEIIFCSCPLPSLQSFEEKVKRNMGAKLISEGKVRVHSGWNNSWFFTPLCFKKIFENHV